MIKLCLFFTWSVPGGLDNARCEAHVQSTLKTHSDRIAFSTESGSSREFASGTGGVTEGCDHLCSTLHISNDAALRTAKCDLHLRKSDARLYILKAQAALAKTIRDSSTDDYDKSDFNPNLIRAEALAEIEYSKNLLKEICQ